MRKAHIMKGLKLSLDWILVFALSLCPSNLATPLTLRKFSKRPEKSFSTCLQSTSGVFALFSSFHPSENCPSCSIFWFACRSKKIPKDWNHTTRSSKSGWVLPTQIFGLFGPPKKRINFDKFSQRQKCVFCVLNGSVYVSRHETCYVVITWIMKSRQWHKH